MRANGDLGHKLGPKLSDLMVRATIAARTSLGPHEARVTAAALQQLIDRAGHEVGSLYRPLVADALKSGQLPDEIHAMVDKATSGRHQWQALIGLSGLGGAVASPIGAAIGAAGAPFLQQTMRAFPYLIPGVGELAAMAQKGIITFGFGADQAKAQGYDEPWFQRLVELAQLMPDAASLFDMVNRGLLNADQMDLVLERAGMPATFATALKELRHVLLPPADAALAVLRGNMTPAAGVEAAARAGVDAGDFGILIGNTGEPLGLDQLLEAFRRRFIDQPTLERGIRQSRVRNEWIPTAVKLRFQPMTTADAVMAAVQGHISLPQAKSYAEQNGLDPADFQALYDTAGEPLSRTEMEQLYNRGEVTLAEVEQALKESQVKNKYVGAAVKLHVRLPPERTVVAMISHGVLTHAEGIRMLMDLGYTAQVAAQLYAEGTTARAGAHGILPEGQVIALYDLGGITRAAAVGMLEKLNYAPAVAEQLVAIADLRASVKLQQQAVDAIRGRYVAHHIDDLMARAMLADLDVTAVKVTHYLKIWAIERAAAVRQLTPAQIIKAQKLDLFGDTDKTTGHSPTAEKRLVALGYSPGDAALIVAGA
jgi:hypothetical protein